MMELSCLNCALIQLLSSNGKVLHLLSFCFFLNCILEFHDNIPHFIRNFISFVYFCECNDFFCIINRYSYNSVSPSNLLNTYKKSTTIPMIKNISRKPCQSYMNDTNDNTGVPSMIIVITTAPIISIVTFILFLP